MTQAAGILYVTPEGQALFIKRSPTGDHAGEWCFAGGTVEAGETAIAAAEREAAEELGGLIEGEHTLWTRSVSPTNPELTSVAPPVDFTTFLQRVPKSFEPVLNDEHVGFAWAPIDQPPQPLHPGCQIALDKFTMNELDIARAIRDQRLTSPQQYQNIWLYDIRVTGTGLAYRSKLNEYVYRRPENYLTGDFLARCNGLSIIVDHPDEPVLNTKQYKKRVIGSSFLPYIKGDEVWTIAKVQDDAAAAFMNTVQVSTSPGVLFIGSDTGFKMTLEDGKTLLVEDAPDFVDHLAICENGVWDKGGPPVGVVATGTTGEHSMEKTEAERETERKDAEERSRQDAAAYGEKLDKMLSHVDSFIEKLDAVSARMDSIEEAMKKDAALCETCGKMHDGECRKDGDDGTMPGEAERVAADKTKKDGEVPAEAMADKTKKDGDLSMVDKKDSVTRDDISRLEKLITGLVPASDADQRSLLSRQAAADKVFMAFGDAAPRPLQGENETNYRIRLAEQLQGHTVFKDSNLKRIALADVDTFGTLEAQIYEQALQVAHNPSTVPAGQMRVVRKDTGGGHTVLEFIGKPSAWMDEFRGGRRQYVQRFKDDQVGVR